MYGNIAVLGVYFRRNKFPLNQGAHTHPGGVLFHQLRQVQLGSPVVDHFFFWFSSFPIAFGRAFAEPNWLGRGTGYVSWRQRPLLHLWWFSRKIRREERVTGGFL
jgi:hypothetical protein